MGSFDTLNDNGNSAQVKCWKSQMKVFQRGAKVPKFQDLVSYTICLPSYEGTRFALILKGVFEGFTSDPFKTWSPYIDKWGERCTIGEDIDLRSPVVKALKALMESMEEDG